MDSLKYKAGDKVLFNKHTEYLILKPLNVTGNYLTFCYKKKKIFRSIRIDDFSEESIKIISRDNNISTIITLYGRENDKI